MKYLLICLATSSFLVAAAPSLQAEKQSADARLDTVQSMKNQLAALSAPPSEDDRRYQDLTLVHLPDLIESLALQHRFDEAQQLAQLKLTTARRLFGDQSITALDALQDLLFLSVQKHDSAQRDQYLGEYATLVARMKHASKQELVDEANEIRSRRLQRKLEAAQAILHGTM